MYEKFTAVEKAHGRWTKTLVDAAVLPQETVPSMRVVSQHGYTYITKEQAMEFFGLIEEPAVGTRANRYFDGGQ